jgi:hypothetical protein
MYNYCNTKNKSTNKIALLKKMLVAVLMLFSFDNSYSQIPNDFKKIDVFNLDSSALETYSSDINNAQGWRVFIENDSLKIKKYNYEHDISKLNLPPNYDSTTWAGVKGDIVSVKVFNGWIVGLDAGEFGGNLKWYSENNKENYKISGMVHQLEKNDNSVFALTGLYHMGLSEGYLLKIDFNKQKNKWISDVFYKCEKYPFAFTRIRDNIYILTASDLIKIDSNKNVQVLIKNGFWDFAYPNSMTFYKGSIYVGMRGGIMKVTDDNGKIIKDWYENIIKIY